MGWMSRRQDVPEDPPSWPDEPATGRRVLVEHPDPSVRTILQRDLTERGYDVLTCGGPRPVGEPHAPCPLLRQAPCPAVEDADVVVSGLSLTEHISRMTLRRIARRGTPPLVLMAPAAVVDEHGDEMTPHHVFPVSGAAVARAIDEVV